MSDEKTTAEPSGYAASLRDPRWQRIRLQILQRDDFRCVACGDAESTLTVHHKRYSGKPWESGEADLQTLCEKCHDALGRHPKGGVFFEWRGDNVNDHEMLHVVFEHCPLCGCKGDDSHSGVVAFDCGHFFGISLDHAGLVFQWQESRKGVPRLVLAERPRSPAARRRR